MQFRAKLYLKKQSFCTSFKFQPFYANLCKNNQNYKKFFLPSLWPLNISIRCSSELSSISNSKRILKDLNLVDTENCVQCTAYERVTTIDLSHRFTSCRPKNRYIKLFSTSQHIFHADWPIL